MYTEVNCSKTIVLEVILQFTIVNYSNTTIYYSFTRYYSITSIYLSITIVTEVILKFLIGKIGY